MTKNCNHPSRPSAAGLAIGCILALIAAITISFLFDVEPAEASTTNKLAPSVSTHA